MKGLGFTVSCLRCGSECELLAPGRTAGDVACAVVRCVACRTEHLTRVTLETVPSWESLRRQRYRRPA